MKRFLMIVLVVLTAYNVTASGPLNLRDITNGTYFAPGIHGVVPMLDGKSYSQLTNGNQQIIRYSFENGEALETLFDVRTARNIELQSINGYILSPDGRNILIQTETKGIYRHSFTAVFYVYNVKNKTLVPLSKNGPQRVPVFSPDGNCIAFVRDNNIFLVKLLFNNSESQVTKDGKYNEIINGTPDWVNEEEFSFNRAIEFSADSKMLAWIRYDETKVPLYFFPRYGALAASNTTANYPVDYSYKYPMAGCTNSEVSVLTYDIKNHVTRTMKLPLDKDDYIPRIKFTDYPDKLLITTLNRHQNIFNIYIGNPRSTVCKLSIHEEVTKYIPESTYDDLFVEGNNIVLKSDRSGYRELYLYSLDGQFKQQLTEGEMDVIKFFGFDNKEKYYYYSAYDKDAMHTAIYRANMKGKVEKISENIGWNEAVFSASKDYFINTYSNAQTPPSYTLCKNNGKKIVVLKNNEALKKKLNGMLGTKKFFTFTTSEGVKLNGWMVKPIDFDASKKYPVVMYQYSGPGSQQVKDSWSFGFSGGGIFESYLAQEGYITVCVDGRGTGGRGRDFEKSIYLRMGDLESKDQVEAALYLGTLPYIDKNNIAIWGWSFGGFNTLMSMSEGRKVFKAGVAIAPPTNWKFYDTIYTERYMLTPKENSNGYDCNPMVRADNLSGDLLLIHGTADDNVIFVNTMKYCTKLVEANKQFDMQIYPDKNHSIYGGNTRYHLMTRVTNFFDKELKNN